MRPEGRSGSFGLTAILLGINGNDAGLPGNVVNVVVRHILAQQGLEPLRLQVVGHLSRRRFHEHRLRRHGEHDNDAEDHERKGHLTDGPHKVIVVRVRRKGLKGRGEVKRHG